MPSIGENQLCKMVGVQRKEQCSCRQQLLGAPEHEEEPLTQQENIWPAESTFEVLLPWTNLNVRCHGKSMTEA